MNFMLIIVAVIFILCAVSGLRAGFLKKASGILSFILAGFLVTAILPYVTTWLRSSTPVYSFLQQQCATAAENIAENVVKNGLSALSGTGGQSGSENGLLGSGSSSSASGWGAILNSDGSVNRSAVKALLEEYGYDSSAIDSMSDDQIKSLISQYAGISAGALGLSFTQTTALLSTDAFAHGSLAHGLEGPICAALLTTSNNEGSSEQSTKSSAAMETLAGLLDAMTASDKRTFIESLPIPEYLQEQMETFNNDEGYKKLGATDFASYIVNYFASLILNVIAYIISLLIAWLIIRLILGAAGIFTRLPLVRTVNHGLGLVLGCVQGLLLVWVLFMVLSFFAATPVGQSLLSQVYKSPFLETVYNTNLLLKGASSAMKGIM